jgi:uncharacterized membrane protein
MNAAHVHLITNHIPIIGLFCGLFVLLWGILAKNKSVVLVGTVLLLICSIGGVVANKSGEEAEDLVEQIAGVSKTAIHEHEEAAELAMPFMFISILLSAAALFLNKRNHKWASMVTILLLVSSALSCILSSRAGWLGGKIRHQTEINAGTSTASPGIHAEEKERE